METCLIGVCRYILGFGSKHCRKNQLRPGEMIADVRLVDAACYELRSITVVRLSLKKWGIMYHVRTALQYLDSSSFWDGEVNSDAAGERTLMNLHSGFPKHT